MTIIYERHLTLERNNKWNKNFECHTQTTTKQKKSKPENNSFCKSQEIWDASNHDWNWKCHKIKNRTQKKKQIAKRA